MEISLGAQRSDRSFCVRPSLRPCCGNYPCRQHYARGCGIFAAPQFPTFSTVSALFSRPESTLSGHSGPRPWTPQLGGERVYRARLGKGRSLGESRHSVASARWPSPPFCESGLSNRAGRCSALFVGVDAALAREHVPTAPGRSSQRRSGASSGMPLGLQLLGFAGRGAALFSTAGGVMAVVKKS